MFVFARLYQDIIQLVVGRRSRDARRVYSSSYALRLLHAKTGEAFWLHSDLTMYQVRQKYESLHPADEWRYCYPDVYDLKNAPTYIVHVPVHHTAFC